MYPIYKFELTANGMTQRAFPIYGDDLAKNFEKETGQQFFRAKLSGNLTFENADYSFITAQAFDTEFGLEIFISYDAGQTWATYWRGNFWKTDCKFDDDSGTVVVEPTVLDQYTAVLAGMDKEYNLIDLAPEIIPVKADKRPMTQIYVPGETTIGCFLSGMWWEQECEAVTDETELTDTYHFRLRQTNRVIELSGNTFPPVPAAFVGSVLNANDYAVTNGNFEFRYVCTQSGTQYHKVYSIYYQNTLSWQADITTNAPTTVPETVILTPVGSATGNVTMNLRDVSIYGRLITDVDSQGGVAYPPIPEDDIVENNRNYHFVVPFSQYDIVFSTELWDIPTEWGLYQPGKYYQVPDFQHEYYPVGRSAWGATSIWLLSEVNPGEYATRKEIVIKHSYPVWSVISVLLNQIAPDITHNGTTAYSEFLYGTNLIGITQTLLITPKSNVISAGYDQPAQKAPITLRDVLDMLRDCFRCYWFIDEQNRFRVEHIQFFRKGGSYTGSPVVGIDLTAEIVTRNGKAWAFARDQYGYDKPAMAARYQFGWMDDVTQLFEGYPIDIISKFVNPDNVEQVIVAKFTSDIDYILLNPGAISKDGFVLLGAIYQSGAEQVNYNLGSYELRNYNIVQATGKYGTSATYKHIVIPVVAGRTIRVVASSNNGTDARIAWLTSNAEPVSGGDVPFVPGTSLIVQARATTEDYIVPNGATYMFVYFSSSPYNYRPESVTMLGQAEDCYLPYYNFTTAIAEHYLQNGYVAFAFLQQYYAYDMPAWEYAINGVQKTAYGVKRLKNQTLTFPAIWDPDLVELIKTNLGNGEIAKLSLNLSSRGANATLNFDVEGGGGPSTEYRVVFGDASHFFAANGGSYTLVVYGVKYENGIEIERTQLDASALTITKTGDAPISRSGLTFSASNLGTTETTAKTANWLVKWNAQNVSATFLTTQEANIKTVTGQTTTYEPTQTSIIWDNSGTTVANGQIDYATFVPSVRIIVTQNYVFSSGVSGNEVVSNVLNRIDTILNVVSGDGLYLFEQGSGNERTYRIQWAQNSTGNVRQGTLRLIYDEQHWDYAISQAAVEQNVTYSLEIDPVNYMFPVSGETITLSVDGVTRTNGVETSREYLTASELTFTSSGDNVATRNGLQFTAADISAIYQDYTSQNWHIVWNAHPIATANLALGQMANIFGYPEWIKINNQEDLYEISDLNESMGWIEYSGAGTGYGTIYIAIESSNVYMGVDAFDDYGMTQGDVIGTVTGVGPLAPFTPPAHNNYLVYGSPIIENNIFTPNQDAIGFIYTNMPFNPGAGKSWTIQTKIKMKSHIAWRDLFSTVLVDGTSIRSIEVQSTDTNGNRGFAGYLSTNGTSWNLASNMTTGNLPQVNDTWYKIQLVCTYNNGSYAFKAGYPDSSSWTGTTTKSSPPLYNNYISFGGGLTRGINAEFDLTETKIWIDGVLWWEAIPSN